MRVRLWLIFAPGLLAACVPPEGPADCGAEAYRSLEGQPLSALEALRPAGDCKVDPPTPDGTVTLEEFPERVRVTVDDQDRIIQVFCG